MTKIAIESIPNSGGSGFGISHLKTICRCPKKAMLNIEHGGDSSFALDVGTIYHAYHQILNASELAGTENVGQYELCINTVSDASAEAARLFGTYQSTFTRSATPIAVEEKYPRASHLEVDRKILNDFWDTGLPLTLRMDRVDRIDKKQAAIIAEERNIILTPGVYVRDYKTRASDTQYHGLEDTHGVQVIFYLASLQMLRPDWKLQGGLWDIVIKTKTPKFLLRYRSMPTDDEIAGVRKFIKYAERLHNQDPFAMNLDACFFPYACPHFLSGACTRR